MRTADEIAETFRVLGLDSPSECERFERLARFSRQSETEERQSFRRTTGGSSEACLEAEDAGLE